MSYFHLFEKEVKKAFHGEEVIEHTLPVLYQRTISESLKSIMKQMMDANKRHEELLGIVALSKDIDLSTAARAHASAEDLIFKFNNEISNARDPLHLELFTIPTLQKIIYQQIADYKIIKWLSKEVQTENFDEDLEHILEESAQILQELKMEMEKNYPVH